MPLSDFGSFVVVMDEISLHWADVNTALGGTTATDLKLEGALTRAGFLTMKEFLDSFLIGFEDLENAREIGAGARDSLKGTLRQKLGQFRGMLRGVLPKSKYAAAAPPLPNFGTDESKFLAPFDDAASLWLRIDGDTTIAGFTPPLVIAGLTQALFVADITACRAAYHAIREAENNLNVARKERTLLLDEARERMVQYRAAVEGIFGPTHPLTLSLPALSTAPGSTPMASTLSGHWNGTTGEAEFIWTASDDPNLDHYQMRMSPGQMRMSPGATYDAATATVVANLPAGTLNLSTTAGLESPGNVASFKLFVVLTTGNEAGSNTVTISRP